MPTSANARMLEAVSRDFRTDTITIPTDDMFQAWLEASRGDDVYKEDDTTKELEEYVARITGKEAALFCVSGTMSNQLAIRTHLTQPPHSVLLDARSHIHAYEAGGVALHCQANSLAILPSNGHHLTLEDVEENIVRGDDIHSAPTRVVALENTLSGTIFPQDEITRISEKMHSEGVLVHCDGARLWEVHAKTGTSMEDLCKPFDSVSLCLSKGLGAPVGSVLIGSKAFIKKATWFRKLFGGGIRQSGALAASGLFVIKNTLPQLPRTHELARSLAVSLSEMGVRITEPVETNMVWIETAPLGFSIPQLIARAKESNITLGSGRIVVHFQVDAKALEHLIQLLKELKEEYKSSAVGMDEVEEERSRAFAKGDWKSVAKTRLIQRVANPYRR
ncbi:aromatic amino acid beta-eliminating lyase/threonine aldolase [Meredithblackwellia eburnea MCA 4105]